MASVISALTSGGGGISMTGDASGILNLNSNGTTVASVSSTGMAVTGTLSATGAVSGTTGTFTGAVTTPLSYVRLNTANGYGSTNTKIRRFTNIVDNVGTDITYADSATLGGTFTINTNGVYSVSYNDNLSGANNLGLSINSTQLTTVIESISAETRLATSTSPGANFTFSTSAIFYAAATSIIRAHNDGTATGIAGRQNFTIARVQ
jgi:hypothetical protein